MQNLSAALSAANSSSKNLLSRAEQQASVQVRTVPYKSVLVANGTILRIGTAGNFLKRRI